jgi:hypothetical protein
VFDGADYSTEETVDITVNVEDTIPPLIVMDTPSDGDNGVAVDTNIIIEVSDSGSGVNSSLGSISMTVEGSPVTPVVSVNGSSMTLTYDPPTNFSYSLEVNITVTAQDQEGNATTDEPFSFQTGEFVDPTLDTDGDGIPDVVEATLGTSPILKTLFVRPWIESETVERSYTFWSDFKAVLFPDPDPDLGARDGFATIGPFRDRDVEVSIIGDPAHPYYDAVLDVYPMRDVNYDPALDPNSPPCDIMEVYYERQEEECPDNDAEGHIYFNGRTWSWDTKGLTPDISLDPGAPPSAGTPEYDAWYLEWLDWQYYLKYQYHRARVYKKPLDNYVNEGPYGIIRANETPTGVVSTGTTHECTSSCTGASPMNYHDTESGPPYSSYVSGIMDETVEFNTLDYVNILEVGAEDPLGRIQSVGARNVTFHRDLVLARTVVHEMGHTLMNASNSFDHCSVTGCIMSGDTENTWILMPFGAPLGCIHNDDGSRDIENLVHNNPH